MRNFSLLICFALLSSMAFAAVEFSVSPYLYSGETDSLVSSTSFSYNNQTAKLYKVNGEEALVALDGKLIEDKAQIRAILSDYYYKNFYPTAAELADIQASALAFNASRNYKTQFGPAEQICYTGGTFLSYKPCSDMATCMVTASMVCSVTGAQGCEIDTLATYILHYKKGIDKLNAAYSKFSGAYDTFSVDTATTAFNSMTSAFSDMKAAADDVSTSKLRFTNVQQCPDCLGVCPEAKFDYGAITSGKAKVDALRAKVAPMLSMELTIEKVALSTAGRIAFKAGEEKAAIFQPRYDAVNAKYPGLKSQAVEAKALVSDASFVSSVDSFLNKGEQLESKFATRQFDGFDALLSAYDASGKNLSVLINNSSAPYKAALSAQDDAGDALIAAQWSVNRLSKASVDSYNALASRKNRADSDFKPPKTSAEYASLASKYNNITAETKTYIAASKGMQESVFGAGNAFSRTSIDAAMVLANSVSPVSFKTRQSVAKFIPPLMIGAVDLVILVAVIAGFAYVFFHFRRMFQSKVAVSGWVLTLLGFMFLLIIGSVGFYSIVISTERFTSFTDFMDTVKGGSTVAIIVDEKGATTDGIANMRACSEQVEAQLHAMGKKTMKYYVSGASCTSIIQRNSLSNSTNNSTSGSYQYDTKTGLKADDCLNSIPDVPIFDLQYSSENQVPVFTTVVTKQGLFKGNAEYYGEKPMCDPANVLG